MPGSIRREGLPGSIDAPSLLFALPPGAEDVQLARDGRFPKPRRIGPNSVGYDAAQIEAATVVVAEARKKIYGLLAQ